jgi:hypothetical protein
MSGNEALVETDDDLYVNIEVNVDGDTDWIQVKRWVVEKADRRHGVGFFSGIIADLSVDCLTFADIARKYKLTKERVRQYYRDYLSDICPRRNGRERMRHCSINRPHFQYSKKYTPEALTVWRKARRAGLDVSCYNVRYQTGGQAVYSTLLRTLLINGERCQIGYCHTPWQSNRGRHQEYYRHSIGRKALADCEFIILVNGREHVFIIPIEDLREWVGAAKRKNIYIHKGGEHSSSYRLKFDIYKYKDNWELLRTP